MKNDNDINILIPAEYVDALLEVMNTGLKRANIDHTDRKELMAWWSVEKEFILDSKKSNS